MNLTITTHQVLRVTTYSSSLWGIYEAAAGVSTSVSFKLAEVFESAVCVTSGFSSSAVILTNYLQSSAVNVQADEASRRSESLRGNSNPDQRNVISTSQPWDITYSLSVRSFKSSATEPDLACSRVPSQRARAADPHSKTHGKRTIPRGSTRARRLTGRTEGLWKSFSVDRSLG